MDGWEVLRRIRENPAVRRLPVLILTARASVESIANSGGPTVP